MNSMYFILSGGSTGACFRKKHWAHNPEHGPAKTGSAVAKCKQYILYEKKTKIITLHLTWLFMLK